MIVTSIRFAFIGKNNTKKIKILHEAHALHQYKWKVIGSKTDDVALFVEQLRNDSFQILPSLVVSPVASSIGSIGDASGLIIYGDCPALYPATEVLMDVFKGPILFVSDDVPLYSPVIRERMSAVFWFQLPLLSSMIGRVNAWHANTFDGRIGQWIMSQSGTISVMEGEIRVFNDNDDEEIISWTDITNDETAFMKSLRLPEPCSPLRD